MRVSAREWPYSSYLDYVGKREGKICKKEPILSQFKNISDYSKFIDANALYLKNKKDEKKYLLEE